MTLLELAGIIVIPAFFLYGLLAYRRLLISARDRLMSPTEQD